jgi:hypothetical protein
LFPCFFFVWRNHSDRLTVHITRNRQSTTKHNLKHELTKTKGSWQRTEIGPVLPIAGQISRYNSRDILNFSRCVEVFIYLLHDPSRSGPGSSVGIATGYGLDVRGPNTGGGAIFRTCPDRSWGPTSYTMGTGSFPGVESGRSVKLTPHPLLVPWFKNRVDYTSTLPKGLRGL